MILIIVAIIVLIMIGVGICIHFELDYCGLHYLQFALATALIICTIVLIFLGTNYADHMIVNDKIDLYREENEKIEQQIATLVSTYMEHEAETFKSLKNEDAITLINLYPDLKSSELVSKELEIYIANNNKIKELETEKLQYKVIAFWLFLGNE